MVSFFRRVYLYETAGMPAAHHAAYIRWFEEARVEYMRAGGIAPDEWTHLGIVFPITEIQCEYRHPARYDDELEIHVRLKEVSRIRLHFYYETVRRADGLVLALGSTAGPCAKASDGKIIRMPKEQLGKLIRFSEEDRGNTGPSDTFSRRG